MSEQPSTRRLIFQPMPGTGIVRRTTTGGGDAGGAGTTVVDGGGPTLTAVQVQLIFWGASWNANPSPSIASVERDVTTIFDGPYMSVLDQYNGVGRGALLGTTLVTSSSPPNSFTDVDVTNLISDLLQGGILPGPDDKNQIFYCVIMPANVRSEKFVAPNFVIGEHGAFSYSVVQPTGVQTVTAHWAWLTHDGTSNDLTTVFSHELVESCTDPEGTGIQLNAPGICTANQGSWCEIGDVCTEADLVCGVRVQAYWSARDNACVIPKGIKSGQVAANPESYSKASG